MLSDMQLYSSYGYYGYNNDDFDSYWNSYRSQVNPHVKMLFWDLQGYGRGTPLELKNDILMASGFSDKLLSVIPKMWKDENALVREQLVAVLAHLTEDQRQVIILKFIEGQSNAEVARILGKPVGAVKSLQHRALAAIRRIIERETRNDT